MPVFVLRNPNVDVGVGIGVRGRIGWEFGAGLSAEISLGVMWNAAQDDTAVPPAWTGYGMSNVWVGAGLRYSFLNATAVVPFLGAAISLDIWNDSADIMPSMWSDDTFVTVGFHGVAGVQFELSNYVGLEVGAELVYNLKPDGSVIFGQPEMWVRPFAGVTFYY